MRRRLLLLILIYLPQPSRVAAREGGGATLASVNTGKQSPGVISSYQEERNRVISALFVPTHYIDLHWMQLVYVGG